MLSIFPYNNKVRVFTTGEPDRWGIVNEDKTGTEHDCLMSFNTKLEKIPVADGKEAVFTASIYFPQKVSVKVDDLIEFTDDLGNVQKKKVMQVQFKRDFAREVFAVKAVI